MSKYLLHLSSLMLLLFANPSLASIADVFKDEDGHTKWQHVANFSGGLLITLLTITLIFLALSYRNTWRANRELKEIKKNLEIRVQERTANLATANQALEAEIGEHKATTHRLRTSQAYIKSILDSMPLMLIGLNKELEITQWNTSAEKITGAKNDQVLGKNLWDAYPTITLTPEQVREVLETGASRAIQHSQRGQYYFDITLYALQGNDEVGLVILLDDVTKRVKAENRMIELDKMASMGELAATMAQDIDTPLQKISGSLSRMYDFARSEEMRSVAPEKCEELTQCLESALESSDYASAIVNNLDEFATHQGGNPQQVKIPDILEHTIATACKVISEPNGLKFRDIPISRNIQNNLSLVPCKIAELQQVFLGIFRHACHALGRCERADFQPKISIEVNEFYDAIWIKINHNGVGLSPEEQINIFEPYFLNAPENNGSLGTNRLSFAYFSVTEHHHGQMAVTSDVEVGTTFHVQLQIKK
ncbi:PAS domain S-box-containing protein [Alteromonadaceae bacterium 2753L.S.0a.02]|nr:PAS domain S-box-containing protein [Alteromonadaceae bacterium 2753L.S.0a.02]